MDLFDKLNDFAKNATEKTNNAIESSKLSSKIDAEQRNLNAIAKKIGDHFIAKMDAGEVFDEEASAMYEGILQGRKNIEDIRADLESLKAPKAPEAEQPAAPAAKFCPNCGTKLNPESKFCTGCGKQV